MSATPTSPAPYAPAARPLSQRGNWRLRGVHLWAGGRHPPRPRRPQPGDGRGDERIRHGRGEGRTGQGLMSADVNRLTHGHSDIPSDTPKGVNAAFAPVSRAGNSGVAG